MHIEKELLCTMMFTIPLLLTAQDSPDHAECLSARFFEEQESGAQVSSSVSLKPELRFTNKIVIGSGPLTYYYYHRGTTQNMEDAVAIAFSSKYVQGGFGRGRPDIARGIILGNTMMRMTADPVFNFRMSDLKVRIKNYVYYPSLAYIGSKIKNASLFLFRHDGTRCAAGEYKRKRFQCGAAYYHTEDPVTEFWMKISGETLPATFNASVSHSGPNHLAADVLFRSGSLRWHAAAVHLFPSFTDHRGDSKWGTGLCPGSTAFAAGHVFRAGRWKWKNVFYGIFHDDYLERRLMSDAEV
ncbi:MAG: hypothetical protein U5N26_00800 [Candidatus Marinimicrobia bacterium]|nr:hypothetical protein [Candidatus Neomarinimicrobiota bacterium]